MKKNDIVDNFSISFARSSHILHHLLDGSEVIS